MGWRNSNDPLCGHSCFYWGHGTLVCDSCYHYDDDDLVWSLTCCGTHEHALGMMKKPMKPLGMLKKPLKHQMGQMTHSVVICGLHGYRWLDGVR